MTKHYCDMCGKEIEDYDLVNITMEYPYETKRCVDSDEYWEMCSECAHKVRDFVKDGGEICQQ